MKTEKKIQNSTTLGKIKRIKESSENYDRFEEKLTFLGSFVSNLCVVGFCFRSKENKRLKIIRILDLSFVLRFFDVLDCLRNFWPRFVHFGQNFNKLFESSETLQ